MKRQQESAAIAGICFLGCMAILLIAAVINFFR